MGQLYVGDRHFGRQSGGTFFYHSDWLGTVRLTNPDQYPYSAETCTSLPFGDALTCNSTYGSNIHFTGKEHDYETGLDDFGARFDSSNFGRFTAPDPLMNSGRPWDPQTWNRYAYALNNPMNIVDTTGLYDVKCQAGDKKCRHSADQLAKAIQGLQKKVNKLKDGAQKDRLQAGLTALGTEGDHNGVFAAFGALKGDAAAVTDYSYANGQLNATTTFDSDKISNSPIGELNEYAIDAVHEGTHIEDAITEDLYGSPYNPQLAVPLPSLPSLSPFSQEYRGYQTSVFAASALGLPSFSRESGQTGYVLWNGSWGKVDQNITRFVTSFHDANGKPDHPETNPHNPWPN
jgi:RHS repeat-associated protein